VDEATDMLLAINFVLFPVIGIVLVVTIGAVVLVSGIAVALVGFIPKFVTAHRGEHVARTRLAMLCYLVAPTTMLVLGGWLAWRLQAHTYIPGIEAAFTAHNDNAWVVGAAIFIGLCVVTILLSACGVYVWSFAWPHQAYVERGFNQNTTLQLGVLFLGAFLVPVAIQWVVAV